jgi:hypothetical protein
MSFAGVTKARCGIAHTQSVPVAARRGACALVVSAKISPLGFCSHIAGSIPSPFAADQGWQITEGCFRLQNADLTNLVTLVKGGETFTVT